MFDIVSNRIQILAITDNEPVAFRFKTNLFENNHVLKEAFLFFICLLFDLWLVESFLCCLLILCEWIIYHRSFGLSRQFIDHFSIVQRSLYSFLIFIAILLMTRFSFFIISLLCVNVFLNTRCVSCLCDFDIFILSVGIELLRCDRKMIIRS